MRTTVVAATVWAIAFAVAPSLRAAEAAAGGTPPAAAPAADSIVAWALARSPEIAAARAGARAAALRAPAARGLEDPMLEVFYQNVGFPASTLGEEEMSMLGVEIRQALPFFGKRSARHAAMAAEADVLAAELRAVERRVTKEVRLLYARLYALEHRRDAVLAADALLVLLADAAAGRYAAGAASMEAPLRAQLGRSRLQLELQEVAAAEATTLAELERILGEPMSGNWGRIASLPPVSPPPADGAALAARQSPEVAAREAAFMAAESAVRMEEREGRPDLFAGADYAARGDFDPVVTLRLGTALPVWRGGRQGPRVDSARAAAAMARAELQQARADSRARARRALAEWERSDRQAELLRDAILPQSRMTLEAARAAYETGQAPFSTLIEDFEVWLAAGRELAEQEAARYAAWADLQELLVPPGPGTGGNTR